MTRHKYTNAVCSIIVVISLIITVIFLNGENLGMTVMASDMPYVDKIFTTDVVHTINITVDEGEWQNMLDTASSEEYISCNLIIDGEAYNNVAIRPKGNSSLSTVSSSDSDRYSFKIEFDKYNNGNTYYGLDKLCLNNIIQDNTYLKDFLSYSMMNYVGADSPLCSYVYITVNGFDWGLYAAAEGIEEAFAERIYGSDYGLIYKPDSLDMNNMGGGQGQDFDMSKISEMLPDDFDLSQFGLTDNSTHGGDNFVFSLDTANSNQSSDSISGTKSDTYGENKTPNSEGAMPSGDQTTNEDISSNFSADRQIPGVAGGGIGGGMSMGSDDVSLIYSDDEYSSYSNIFDNAKFDVTNADKDRLIASLKQLNSGENVAEVVNTNEVIRYFVAHTFVLNGDSYTGSMIHNYYLYEDDGLLSMIAWDYNLAFGSFSMGSSGSSDTTSMVNSPIDTPVLSGTMETRPMLSWIFEDDEYLEQYHQVFDEFISSYFESGYFEQLINNTIEMISPYVEKDPTAFCTYDEFLTAAETLKEFCLLRAESIRGQIDETIPSTSEEQETDSSSFVDASSINISDTGSMGNNMGRGGRETNKGNTGFQFPDMQQSDTASSSADASQSATTNTVSLADIASDSVSETPSTPEDNSGVSSINVNSAFAVAPNTTVEGVAPSGMPNQGGFPQNRPDDLNGTTNSEVLSAESGVQPLSPNTTNSKNTGSSFDTDSSTSSTNEFTVPNQGDQANQNNIPGDAMEEWNQAGASSRTFDYSFYILLGISIVILLGGIIFATKYKR